MKRWLLLVCLAWNSAAYCQEIPAEAGQQLEELARLTESETEDDGLVQELEQFRRRSLDLNSCSREELERFPFLNSVQVNSFMHYRDILGPLLAVYELQAVPSWDIFTIRKILPYLVTGQRQPVGELVAEAGKGEHSFLIRTGSQFQKAAGYRNGTYLGDPRKIFFRYRYVYRNRIQWGITGEKDAGEGFFGRPQRLGFDFYSLHFFYRGKGSLKSLALGDFTVNLGQGLVQWQSLAFGKGAELAGIKRQSPVIRPYTSAGEFNFMRGAALSLQKKHWNTSLFFSLRKLDANRGEGVIRSLVSSGYHRQESELADRAVLGTRSAGGNISFQKGNLHIGINAVHYGFSLPIEKREEPYNRFSIRGREWWNLSIDHSYTLQNLHFFGEIARAKGGGWAIVQGVLFSVHRDADLTLLYRDISPQYQTLYGNAFTQSTLPVNERGIYVAASLRPGINVRVDLYADLYRSGWLKFRADAPSGGNDLSIQCTYSISRRSSFLFRIRARQQEENLPADLRAGPSKTITRSSGYQFRWHLNQQVSDRFEIRCRAEMNFIRLEDRKEEGFIFYVEGVYKPVGAKYAGSLRAAVFDTDSYDSRIYAFESNVLYSYSVPVLSGKGSRFYINTNYKVSELLSLWLRFSATVYKKGTLLGVGAEELAGHIRSDWVFQARLNL